MTHHTKGPWFVGDDDQNGQAVVRNDHIEVATCWHHSVGAIEKEMRANAALIAAAPDMLDGLEYYADQQCEGWCEGAAEWAKFDDCSGCKARCLVAKARGNAVKASIQAKVAELKGAVS